jgi:tRNA G10  N-methylase Trm11
MELICFELGRQKELCFGELISIIGQDKFKFRSKNHAFFQMPAEEAIKLHPYLGGTIKISQVEKTLQTSEISELKNNLEEILLQVVKDREGKILLGLSTFGFNEKQSINTLETLNFLKKVLKNINLNSRFVNKSRENPNSATIFKSRIIQKGLDLSVICHHDEILITKTISIQNIDQYSIRDYEKPYRDAENGMLPPKLSQIMLNLAGTDHQTIYDPFCGNGTILLEAMLMGKTAIGSDISQDMSQQSEANCKWLTQNFKAAHFRTFNRDARFLKKDMLPEKITAIVTEGYLGPPQERPPSEHEAEKIFRELGNLHLNWLKAAHKILEENGVVVMCLTAFKQKKGVLFFPKFAEICEIAGFEIQKKYLYKRPHQVVFREIYILRKV